MCGVAVGFAQEECDVGVDFVAYVCVGGGRCLLECGECLFCVVCLQEVCRFLAHESDACGCVESVGIEEFVDDFECVCEVAHGFVDDGGFGRFCEFEGEYFECLFEVANAFVEFEELVVLCELESPFEVGLGGLNILLRFVEFAEFYA